jgi:transcriptional regulator GlxA family with amidase domain
MAPIQFGVLIFPFQLMDVVGPLDVLSSSSKPYLKSIQELGFPPGLSDKGIDIEFHHIAETLEPETLTGNFRATPTTTFATCPPLDYLLIGGPKFDYISNVPPATAEFIRSRAKEVKILFTTCTGGMVLAATGILDGKTATTNHGAIGPAKQFFSKVNWTFDQWVIDGKFWTAAGACAGMDMFAFWVRENYGAEVAEAGYAALDYEPRGLDRKRVHLKRHEAEVNGQAAK